MFASQCATGCGLTATSVTQQLEGEVKKLKRRLREEKAASRFRGGGDGGGATRDNVDDGYTGGGVGGGAGEGAGAVQELTWKGGAAVAQSQERIGRDVTALKDMLQAQHELNKQLREDMARNAQVRDSTHAVSVT